MDPENGFDDTIAGIPKHFDIDEKLTAENVCGFKKSCKSN